MKILVAPNSFKECADSLEVAQIIHRHILSLDGKMNVISFPISDGGDGFLNVVRHHFNTSDVKLIISKPHNNKTQRVTVCYTSQGKTLFIESADAVGLKVIPKKHRNPLYLNSFPLGELIKKVSETNLDIQKITIGVGGTAINDLGLGLCSVFGLKLLDANGKNLDVIPANFIYADKIILNNKTIPFRIELILDVEVPLLGEKGTSKVFAPQKGASEEEVEILEKGVLNILRILKDDHNLNFLNKKMGAGGGIGLGLSLLSKTKVKVTFAKEFILKKLELQKSLKECDVVITGEGTFDDQSFMNKATGVVIEQAIQMNKKVFLIAGKIEHSVLHNYDDIVTSIELTKYFETEEEERENYKIAIEKAAEEIHQYLMSLM